MSKRKGIRLVNGAEPDDTAPKKFWNIATVSDDEAEITMYGEVLSRQPIDWWTGEVIPGLFITPEGFLEDLEIVKGKSKVTVKLNSVGGDLYTGIAIHNELKGLGAEITVIVEGIAASAGSVIMCSGDDIQVWPGSMVMIHGVTALMWDYYNIQDLRQIIKGFDAAERAIAEIYNAKTGLEVENLRSMMTKEKWMTGREAVEMGFANTLLDGKGPDMKMIGKEILMVNGVQHNIKGLHIPGNLNIPRVTPAVAGTKPKPKAGKIIEGGKETIMAKTVEELRLECPDLVAQLEADTKKTAAAEAIAAERTRIKDIETIEAAVGDPELIADAKYGENPCTASDLSLKALQKQAQLGTKHLAATATDLQNSGAAGVGSIPNGGTGEEPDDEVQQVSAIVDVYNQTKNGGKK